MTETPYDGDTIAQAEPAATATEEFGSIIDTILELDELLSANVTRAQETFRLYRRGDLLATLTDLEDQLTAITDDSGRTIASDDDALGAGDQAHSLALKIQQTRQAYQAESGLIRLTQIDADEWDAFKTKWKAELNKADGPGTIFWNALIAATVSQPALTVTNVIKMRGLYGGPQLEKLGQACWRLNTAAGASLPFSSRASVVLKRAEHEMN